MNAQAASPSDPFEFVVEHHLVSFRRNEVRLSLDGKPYAYGHWQPAGGYVKYAEDGVHSRFSWHLFDSVDKELRKALGWTPSTAPISREAVREAFAVMARADRGDTRFTRRGISDED